MSAAEKSVNAIGLWTVTFMRFGVFSEVSMVKGNTAPGPKVIHKLLRLILWITIGALFIAGGCAACALLWKETDTTKAVLLAVAALIGAAGCLYSVFRFLRVISPTAKGPFILTLH